MEARRDISSSGTDNIYTCSEVASDEPEQDLAVFQRRRPHGLQGELDHDDSKAQEDVRIRSIRQLNLAAAKK